MLVHNRHQVLNILANRRTYRSYLEIGVAGKKTFEAVQIENKECIDPIPSFEATHVMTSDDFFAGPGHSKSWDLIFIDGLHHADQVRRDIDNSLARLNNGGAIVVHDCLPLNEVMQIVPRQQGFWTGDVWKAWAWYRMNRGDLSMYVIDTDLGCGIIERGQQQLYPHIDNLDFQYLAEHKKELLNLISWDTWRYFYASPRRFDINPMERVLDKPLHEVLSVMQRRIVGGTKYLGVQTLKNPLDFWVYQEIIYECKPHTIIEIGNALGGTLLALAHLCDAMGDGKVIGVSLGHNCVEERIKNHPRISLVAGDAVKVFPKVRELVPDGAPVLIIEDSSHTYENTLNVLRTYSQLCQSGDYFIVEDGICHHGLKVKPILDPYRAVETFLQQNREFEADRSRESFLVTWNPHGYLRRKGQCTDPLCD